MKGKRLFKFVAAVLVTMILVSVCVAAGTQAGYGATDDGDGAVQTEEEVQYTASIGLSVPSGLYETAFSLAVTTDKKDGIIRYTLDGSDPTGDSAPYTGEIEIYDRSDEPSAYAGLVSGTAAGFGGFGGGGRNQTSSSVSADAEIFKGMVVKAAVFSQDGERLSAVAVASYFVSEDIFTRYGDLPIVSIVTDADNFFDTQTGIYINYDESGEDWERPVYFEMFETDGTSVIAQNLGVRLNGGTTRSLAQKALRFYARSNYDAENSSIEYDLFEGLTKSYSDETLTTFDRILLRSSGNDNGGTLFRDAFMQAIVADLNVDTQASRSCVVFLNGEFWGIYNIRERYDNNYFATHYDIKKSRVALLEISYGNATPEINEGDETDLAFYNEMWNFFNDNSMTDEANYLKAQEYIDIDNFIDYYIINIYSCNTDWPANNNFFWRYKTDNGGYDSTAVWYKDGRWRWIVKDMDWGFGAMGSVSSDSLSHALNESGGGTGGNRGGGGGGIGFTDAESTLLFRKLLENDEFRAKFINRFCDVMNTTYEVNAAIETINAMAAAIEPAIVEQSARYPSSVSSVSSWQSSVDTMIQFAQQRAGYVRGFLQSRYGLSDVVTVTLKTSAAAGYIRINDVDIIDSTRGVSDASAWSGIYFADTTQTFTAVPYAGHSFVKFVVTDTATGAVTEYTDSVLTLTVGAAGMTVEVVFD